MAREPGNSSTIGVETGINALIAHALSYSVLTNLCLVPRELKIASKIFKMPSKKKKFNARFPPVNLSFYYVFLLRCIT